ncbi:DUF3168 domain-containing protein [Amorphus sp. 3PC139-8]|uniref:DUF3168 domain-containing protein n=1 Tax=Amorphus sp. 3PC139-8 TaxID=2735676 RepID=UPI00345C8CE9
MDAGQALRAAIYARLAGDAVLIDRLGGARIYDRPPRAAAHPFVAFGDASDRRLDGDLPPMSEHRVALEVRSTSHGRKQAAELAERIETLLIGAALALDGHRLVSLSLVDRATRFASDRKSVLAVLRLRAVTEPVQ